MIYEKHVLYLFGTKLGVQHAVMRTRVSCISDKLCPVSVAVTGCIS
jgi:hypothetical protein